MHSFTDNAGRTWALKCNLSTMGRVQKNTGHNLMEIAGGNLLTQLSSDPFILLEILWELVKPEAEKASVTAESFAEELGGDALESALFALLDEVSGFFPSGKADVLTAAIRKAREVDQLTIADAAKVIEAMDSRAIIAEVGKAGGKLADVIARQTAAIHAAANVTADAIGQAHADTTAATSAAAGMVANVTGEQTQTMQAAAGQVAGLTKFVDDRGRTWEINTDPAKKLPVRNFQNGERNSDIGPATESELTVANAPWSVMLPESIGAGTTPEAAAKIAAAREGQRSFNETHPTEE